MFMDPLFQSVIKDVENDIMKVDGSSTHAYDNSALDSSNLFNNNTNVFDSS